MALQWQVGQPLVPPQDVGQQCVRCRGSQDAFGDHAVSCRAQGLGSRHTVVLDALLDLCRQAGVTCSKEEALGDGSRPADLLIHHWCNGGPLAVDITIVNPLRPSVDRPSPDKVRAFLLEQERAKERKYLHVCEQAGWAFQPLVFTPWASSTSRGSIFLHRLSRLYAENTAALGPRSERVALFWQTLTSAIMGQIAMQLRLATMTGGAREPLPHVEREVDEAGNESVVMWRGRQRPQPKRPREGGRPPACY